MVGSRNVKWRCLINWWVVNRRVRNVDVAKVLMEIADLLELQEEQFKPRAYRRAARAIEHLPEDIADVAARDGLEQIPGVGKAIAKKIKELLETGKLQYLEKLRKQVPPGLVELLRVPDIGPKTARLLHDKLGITSIAQLREALEAHRLRDLPGFGERTEENLLRNLELLERQQERMFIGSAYPLAQRIVEALKGLPGVERINVAGSLRRWKETVGDIDILVASLEPDPIMEAFVGLPEVDRVLARGDTKSSVIVRDGIQVDLRVVKPECFGSALQYFTGSKAHNIALRRIAQKRDWKLSEYGLTEAKTGRVIASRTEEEIYQALGLPWIPPELREDAGEIEAALSGQLPHLVEAGDVKGDLHVHTKWSDGANTIEEMAMAAQRLGYKYLGICDHSRRVRIAHGLDEERLLQQIEEVRRVDEKLPQIRLLAGIEVDILSDGSLDLPDRVLEQTDLVVAAVHYGTKTADEEKMTLRLTRAVENPTVDILAHPTGRIIGQRPPYPLDMDALMEAALDNQVHLEINALERLDLPDVEARRAKERGLKMAVNSDAHQASQLPLLRYAIATARRAWLEPADIINTLPLNQLIHHLKHPHL